MGYDGFAASMTNRSLRTVKTVSTSAQPITR
jgi:hypothetical protein